MKTEALSAKRRRFLDDFAYYAQHALKIRPKDPKPGQGIIPLKLNQAQLIFLNTIWRQWLVTGKIRAIVLKGRQQGLSTMIEGMLYWYTSQRAGMRGMVVAHNGESTNTLFTMTQRYHKECPAVLRPHTKYSSKKELTFDLLDASITVGTAGSDGLGRGETIQFLHASELSFWPANTAAEIWSGLMDTMPPVEGSITIVESTAFGNSGKFYDLWVGAKSGQNEFTPVFIPWCVQEEYTAKAPRGFQRTPDEEKYAAAYEENFGENEWYKPLTNGQLYWRRMKIGEKGLGLFQQEYPLSDDEAFQSSGSAAFGPEGVARLRDNKQQLISAKMLVGDRWEEARSGTLKIYRPHEHGETYVIGADVGAGISTSRKNADWSVATVLDSKKRQVAQLRCRVLPGDFATMTYELGKFYNFGEICMENANHGYHTCQRMARDLQYPRFWTEEVFDKVNEEFTTKLGFTTSTTTKPLVLNKLRDLVATGEIEVNDPITLDEMRTFIIKDNSTMGADTGSHDDTIIALALANHIHAGKWEPVTDYELFDPEIGQHQLTRDVFKDGDEAPEVNDHDNFGAYG